MSDNLQTLDLFFGLHDEDGNAPKELTAAVRTAVAAQLREAAKAVAVAKVFTGKAPETQLDLAASEVIGFLRSSMADLSIPQLLASGWSRYAALSKYANAKEYPPDKTYVEPFFEQTLTSTHQPFVELRLGGVPTGKVEFEIEVKITFEEVSLSIRGGRITSAKPGRATASGALKCEHQQVLERKLGELTLPGELRFNTGIEIAPRVSV
ncbi:MAG TPA: hypothetical protein VGM82_09575 [Gemmatimonadaceae bacterium]|jgi:hypothetical protein